MIGVVASMTELPQPLVTPFAPNLYVSFGDQVLNFEEASRDQWLPGPSDDDKRAQWMALLLDPDVRKVADRPEAPIGVLVEIDTSFIEFETRPALGAAGESASAAVGARPGSSEVIVIEDSDEELL